MRRNSTLLIAIFLAQLLLLERVRAACEIEADKCCDQIKLLGFGDRIPMLGDQQPGVSTFVLHPFERRPDAEDPNRTKVIENTAELDALGKQFEAQLVAEGVAPAAIVRLTVAFQEFTRNATDAHVRNRTDPADRQVVVRWKINHKQPAAKGGSTQLVDQVILEVADNAGNSTAQKNKGTWFDAGRASGISVAKIRENLDQMARQLKNPVQIAKERGLTTAEEYKAVLAEVRKENTPLIEQIADAKFPPDIVAEYFDSKTPSYSEIESKRSTLSPKEASAYDTEIKNQSEFWLDTRNDVRTKHIAVEGRVNGMGGFGSLLMKEWGTRWIYGPNRDSAGQTIGTRSVFVLESPVSGTAKPE